MTIAAVVATTTCVLLVISLLDAMAGLRTLESMHRMRQLVDAQGWSGLSDEQVISVQRTLIFLSGALAATGAVLSVYAARRHRGARALLSVVAALLLFSTALVATLLPMILLVAVVMMWTGEVRDWFDGRDRRRPVGAGPTGTTPTPRDSTPSPPVQANWPPPAPPAAPPSAPAAAPAPWPSPTQALENPYAGPASPPPPPPRPARAPGSRPVAVSIAAWLTGVLSVLTFVALALVVTVLLAARDEAVRALREENLSAHYGISERDLLAALWVFCAVCLFWCVAALVLAVLAYCRVHLARVALAVSAALTAVVGLVAHQVGVLNAVAALVTLALLFSPASNRWYADRDRPADPGGGPPEPDPEPDPEPAEPEPEPDREPSWTGPPPDRPRGKPPVW